MERAIEIILESGRSAIELALYVLLPIMVVMLAVMQILKEKGVLGFVATLLAPVLRPFGIHRLGVFAGLQMLFVSFAAPVATLTVLERDKAPRREVAATLAMILAMSQGNAVFPLVARGLDLQFTMLSSVLGGLIASTVTYRVLARFDDPETESVIPTRSGGNALGIMLNGGWQGVQLTLKSVPILILAILVVNVVRAVGLLSLLEPLLSPVLGHFGLPGIVVLPVATKYLAGGTAMMGVTIDLIGGGALSPVELNRIAGAVINPLDMVGLAVLTSPGPRVKSVVLPAILGGACGIVVRGALHLLVF